MNHVAEVFGDDEASNLYFLKKKCVLQYLDDRMAFEY